MPSKKTLQSELDRVFAELAEKQEAAVKERVELEGEAFKLRAQLATANTKIRDQTEADLLLNALKAVGVIRDEKPQLVYFDRARQLQNQLSDVRNLGPFDGLAQQFGQAGRWL